MIVSKNVIDLLEETLELLEKLNEDVCWNGDLEVDHTEEYTELGRRMSILCWLGAVDFKPLESMEK